MLLANMAKDDSMQRVLELKRDVPKDLSSSKWAIDQLLDCFVKGSYFFADLAKVCCIRFITTTLSWFGRRGIN
jgi:hypothetical protein